MPQRTAGAIAIAGLVVLWLAMMLAGTGPADRALLAALYAADRPILRSFAAAVTLLGNWQSVLLISIGVSLWLLWRRDYRAALLLLGATLIGRALVQFQKAAISRLRPDELEHLVPVKSLAFPSGHAANSMILLLGVALIATPERHRRWAVAAALVGSFCVGISRSMLGVHWPSDVLGGWAFGAAWVLTVVAVSESWRSARQTSSTR
jgi:undecaprenyl-diphosphatase